MTTRTKMKKSFTIFVVFTTFIWSIGASSFMMFSPLTVDASGSDLVISEISVSPGDSGDDDDDDDDEVDFDVYETNLIRNSNFEALEYDVDNVEDDGEPFIDENNNDDWDEGEVYCDYNESGNYNGFTYVDQDYTAFYPEVEDSACGGYVEIERGDDKFTGDGGNKSLKLITGASDTLLMAELYNYEEEDNWFDEGSQQWYYDDDSYFEGLDSGTYTFSFYAKGKTGSEKMRLAIFDEVAVEGGDDIEYVYNQTSGDWDIDNGLNADRVIEFSITNTESWTRYSETFTIDSMLEDSDAPYVALLVGNGENYGLTSTANTVLYLDALQLEIAGSASEYDPGYYEVTNSENLIGNPDFERMEPDTTYELYIDEDDDDAYDVGESYCDLDGSGDRSEFTVMEQSYTGFSTELLGSVDECGSSMSVVDEGFTLDDGYKSVELDVGAGDGVLISMFYNEVDGDSENFSGLTEGGTYTYSFYGKQGTTTGNESMFLYISSELDGVFYEYNPTTETFDIDDQGGMPDTNHLITTAITSDSWGRYSETFVLNDLPNSGDVEILAITGGASLSFFDFGDTSSTTIYVDAFQMEAGPEATPFSVDFYTDSPTYDNIINSTYESLESTIGVSMNETFVDGNENEVWEEGEEYCDYDLSGTHNTYTAPMQESVYFIPHIFSSTQCGGTVEIETVSPFTADGGTQSLKISSGANDTVMTGRIFSGQNTDMNNLEEGGTYNFSFQAKGTNGDEVVKLWIMDDSCEEYNPTTEIFESDDCIPDPDHTIDYLIENTADYEVAEENFVLNNIPAGSFTAMLLFGGGTHLGTGDTSNDVIYVDMFKWEEGTIATYGEIPEPVEGDDYEPEIFNEVENLFYGSSFEDVELENIEEPYVDDNDNDSWDSGEDYCDVDSSGTFNDQSIPSQDWFEFETDMDHSDGRCGGSVEIEDGVDAFTDDGGFQSLKLSTGPNDMVIEGFAYDDTDEEDMTQLDDGDEYTVSFYAKGAVGDEVLYLYMESEDDEGTDVLFNSNTDAFDIHGEGPPDSDHRIAFNITSTEYTRYTETFTLNDFSEAAGIDFVWSFGGSYNFGTPSTANDVIYIDAFQLEEGAVANDYVVEIENLLIGSSFEDMEIETDDEPFIDDNDNDDWDSGEDFCDIDSSGTFNSQSVPEQDWFEWEAALMDSDDECGGSVEIEDGVDAFTADGGTQSIKLSTGPNDMMIEGGAYDDPDDDKLVNLDDGQEYTLSFYAKGAVGDEVIYLSMNGWDGPTHQEFNSATDTFDVGDEEDDLAHLIAFDITSTSYTRYSETFTLNNLPVDGINFEWTFGGSSLLGTASTANDVIYIDAFQLEIGDTANEYDPDGPSDFDSGSDSDTFIEIYNTSSEITTLDAITVQYKFAQGNWTNFGSFSNASIPGHSYASIGADGDISMDDEGSFNAAFENESSTIDNLAFRLCNDGSCATTYDAVGFGNSFYAEGTAISTENWVTTKSYERKAQSTSDITSMTSGVDVIRGNAYDTDDNNNDFSLRYSTDQQNLDSSTETPIEESGGNSDVKIGEIRIDPGEAGGANILINASFEDAENNTDDEPFLDTNDNDEWDEGEGYCDVDSSGTFNSQSVPEQDWFEWESELEDSAAECGGSVEIEDGVDAFTADGGTQSMKLSTGPNDMLIEGGAYDDLDDDKLVNLNEGQQYTLSFYAKGAVGDEVLYLSMNGWDGPTHKEFNSATDTFDVGDEEDDLAHLIAFDITSTSYTRYSETFTLNNLPVDGINFEWTFGGSSLLGTASTANDVIYIDAFQLEEGSSATEYSDGGSLSKTYIELYNSDNADYQFADGQVQYKFGDTSWTTFAGLGTVTMTAHSFYNIGISGDESLSDEATFDSSFDSHSSSIDGMSFRLCDDLACSTVEDLVGLGTGNSDSEGYAVDITAWTSSSSIERKAISTSTQSDLADSGDHELGGNGYDSGNNSLDLVIQENPDFQDSYSETEDISQNIAGVTPGPDSDVLIGEIKLDPTGSGSYVELYNENDSPFEFTDGLVEYRYGSNEWKTLGVITATVSAYGFYNVGDGGDVAISDSGAFSTDFSDNGISIDGYAVRLCSDSECQTVVDTVGIGVASISYESVSVSASGWLAGNTYERKAQSSSDAISMASGGDDELNGNGSDSDDNSVDFVLQTLPSQQTQMSATEEISIAPGAETDVRIGEIKINTPSATYIELYNPSDSSFEFTDGFIEYKFGSGGWNDFAFFTPTMSAYSFYAIGNSGDSSLDDESEFNTDFVNNSSSVDGLSFRLCTDSDCQTVADIVGLGNSATEYETAPVVTSGWNTTMSFERKSNDSTDATSMASGGNTETSGNGEDVGNNSADFVLQSSPSFQTSSSSTEQPEGDEGGGSDETSDFSSLVISEVRVSPAGEGGGANYLSNSSFESVYTESEEEPYSDDNDNGLWDEGEVYCDYSEDENFGNYDREVNDFVAFEPMIFSLSQCDARTDLDNTVEAYTGDGGTQSVKFSTGAEDALLLVGISNKSDGEEFTGLDEGNTYTMSFYAKGESGGEKTYLYMLTGEGDEYNYNTETFDDLNDSDVPDASHLQEFTLTNSWQRYSVTFILNDLVGGEASISYLTGGSSMTGFSSSSNQVTYMDAFQLEDGTISDYDATPPPTSNTFVEIYNRNYENDDFSIENYIIQYKFGSAEWSLFGDIGSNSIGAGYFANTSDDGSIDDETTFNSDFVDNSSTIDGLSIRLCDDSECSNDLDTVGFGDNAESYEDYPVDIAGWDTTMSFERKAVPDATVESMSSGGDHETAGNSYDSNFNYDDFVLQSLPNIQGRESDSEGWDNINFEDMPPFVYHPDSVLKAAESDGDLYIFAEIGDETGYVGDSSSLFYRIGKSGGYTEITGSQTTNGLSDSQIAEFIIPQSALNSSLSGMGLIQYYIDGYDGNFHTYAPEQYDVYPYEVEIVSSLTGNFDFSGTVTTDTGESIEYAFVSVAGTPYYTHTDSSGDYSFSSIPSPINAVSEYRVIATVATKGIQEIFVTDGDTSADIVLNPYFGDFTGGDRDMPFIEFINPGNGSNYAPIEICDYNSDPVSSGYDYCSPIKIEFSKPIKDSTLTTSNIKLYNWDSESYVTGLTIEKIDGENLHNAVQIYKNSGLDTNTTYTIEISNGLTDDSDNELAVDSTGYFKSDFTTYGDAFDDQNDEYGTSENSPPFVSSSSPRPGKWDASTNTNVTINFETPINVADDNLNRVKLYEMDGGESLVPVSRYYSDDFLTLILEPTEYLSSDTRYMVRIQGSFESTRGVSIGDPQSNQNTDEFIFQEFDFFTASTADINGPRVTGTIPENGETNVPVGFGMIELGVSESLSLPTISKSNITFKKGDTMINYDIEYDINTQSLKLFPTSSLDANTVYTITVTTDITDSVGNEMNQDDDGTNGETEDKYVMTFKTVDTIETDEPEVLYAECDDYRCVVAFSETMNRSPVTDSSSWSDASTRWETSVLNPTNYDITVDRGSGSEDISFNDAQFNYENEHNAVIIAGLDMFGEAQDTSNISFEVVIHGADSITAEGVRDVVGNAMTGTQTRGGMVINSAESNYEIGFEDGYGEEGMGDYGKHSADDMGNKPISVNPMNRLAGVSTDYFVMFPTSVVIPSGGYIDISFPTGFDVTDAGLNDDDSDDLNGRAGNEVGAECVGIQETRTVRCTLDADTEENDFLEFELTDIANSSIPKGFETSGYTASIKTKENGTTLESMTTIPFYIAETGDGSLTVKIYTGGADTATTGLVDVDAEDSQIFIGSPMTGPVDQDVNFVDGYATFTISNLPEGEYFIFTPPTLEFSDTEIFMGVQPEPVYVGGDETVILDLTKLDASNSAVLRLYISGSFDDEAVDVWAGSGNGYVTRTFVLEGNLSEEEYILYLPFDGEWFVGMGPAMSHGPMSGAPDMPDWMPPRDIRVDVAGLGESVSIYSEYGENVTDTGLYFDIQSADLEINGQIVNGNEEGIANADIWAYQPMGFDGAGNFTQTDAEGYFTLKVSSYGDYKIGSFKPGMPESREITAKIVENTGEDDGNDTADVYIKGSITTVANPFNVRMNKPDYTISGKVTDRDGVAIQYAPVWGESDNGEFVPGGTDSDGNYILYVNPGTWTLRSELPFGSNVCGSLTTSVEVDDESMSGQNILPEDTTCYTLSGTVSVGGETLSNVPLFIDEWTGDLNTGHPSGQFRNAQTNSSGEFSTSLGNGTFKIGTWSPDYGEIAVLKTISGSDVNDANITIDLGDIKVMTVEFTGGDSTMSGFIDVKQIGSQQRQGRELRDLSQSKEIDLPTGTYKVFVYIDSLGEFFQDNIDLSNNTTVTFDLSSYETFEVSGTVEDAEGNVIENAWVWVGSPDTGYHVGGVTDSNGDYSLYAIEGEYNIGADKPGYLSSEPSDLEVTEDISYDFNNASETALSIADQIITGTAKSASGGTALTEGFVWAESSDGAWGGSPVDSDGGFYIPVIDGVWTVAGHSPGHAETEYSSSIVVAGSSPSAFDFVMTVDATKNKISSINSVTPSVGGVIDENDIGVKLVLPPNALGSGSSAGNLTTELTYTAPSTAAFAPLGNRSTSITVTDNNGSAVTSLNSAMELQMDYDTDDLPNGVDEEDLNLAYWDSTTNQWITLSGTQDTSTGQMTASTDHLTDYAVVYSPLSVQSVTPSSSGTSRRTTDSGDSTDIPSDDNGDSTLPPSVVLDDETAQKILDRLADALEKQVDSAPINEEEVDEETDVETPVLISEPEETDPVAPENRDFEKEKSALEDFVAKQDRLPEAKDWERIQFVSYGTTDKIKSMTQRQRSGLIDDFEDIYGRVPATSSDWKSLADIADGDQPERVLSQEVIALKEFIRVYKRLVDFKIGEEERFIHMVSYRYRTSERNLSKERAALKIFTDVYNKLPDTSHMWSVLRAIAYSEVRK